MRMRTRVTVKHLTIIISVLLLLVGGYVSKYKILEYILGLGISIPPLLLLFYWFARTKVQLVRKVEEKLPLTSRFYLFGRIIGLVVVLLLVFWLEPFMGITFVTGFVLGCSISLLCLIYWLGKRLKHI